MKLGVLVITKFKKAFFLLLLNSSELENESTSTLRRNLTNQAKILNLRQRYIN